MKKELWQSNQPVLSNDLKRAQDTKEEAIRERLIDSFSAGIVPDSQQGAEALPFEITVNASDITIGTGIAYDPTGERIFLSDSTITYVNPTDAGSAPNRVKSSGDSGLPDPKTNNGPLTTTDDGIGRFTATPAISGNNTIPIFLGNVNYLFIDYLQTVTTNVFTLQEGTNKRLFVNADDGYQIRVVESATIVADPTTIQPTVNSIFLGEVDFRGGSGTGILNVVPQVPYNVVDAQVTATTPNAAKSDRTTTYTPSLSVTFDEHVKVVGSGTITDTNPHGLTTTDLGLAGKSTEQHEEFFHGDGIIGSDSSTTSSLFGSVNAVSGAALPPTFGIDTFKVQSLSSTPTELLLVDGKTIDSTNIGSFREIFFLDSGGSLLSDGTYTLYVDTVVGDIRLAANAGSGASVGGSYQIAISGVSTTFTTVDDTTLGTTDFLLWEVVFIGSAGIGAGINNFGTITDKRFFGSIDGDLLLRDSATDTVTINHNLAVPDQITPQVVITKPTGSTTPAVVVRDVATGLVDTVFLDEEGITFPDATKQTTRPAVVSLHYAAIISSGTTSFTVTAGAFTPNLPGSLTSVPKIIVRLAGLTQAFASTLSDGFSASVDEGAPFNGSSIGGPNSGVYFNVDINDQLDFDISTSAGTVTARWNIVAIVE